ncbi:MAG: 30S ribosomal protein S6 [Micavibrio sp. TMED27]|nr:30S ribosomal protein S6 [Micavibrio sp.]OUT92615.1 MAG: 30S ribosomal protein S6 [Micavibrio sp. TMED27]
MPYYETVFISRQDLTDTQVKDLTDQFTKIIEDQGGKTLKTEQWGLKSFAYKINKAKKGHYTLLETDAPAAALIELERVMRINEDVVRAMTIRLDEPTEGPSVMVKKDDRDEKEAA